MSIKAVFNYAVEFGSVLPTDILKGIFIDNQTPPVDSSTTAKANFF